MNCIDCASHLKIVSFFLNPHLGDLANSVGSDQPASSEADLSGSTLFGMQLHDLVDVRAICIHLLK